jgi:serine/threonine protein kinase
MQATTRKDDLATTGRDLGRWGGLILIEEVGHGAYGTVYRAYDPQLDRPVAVKLLRPTSSGSDAGQLASAVLNEGRALARVKHPNVVIVAGPKNMKVKSAFAWNSFAV